MSSGPWKNRKYKNNYYYKNNILILEVYDTKELKKYIVELDKDVLNKVKQYYWQPHSDGRKYGKENKERIGIRGNKIGNRKKIYLHQLIMGEKLIDHIDGNPLNNKRNNLRKANAMLNAQNRKAPNKNNSTGYRGVLYNKKRNTYVARITVNYKRYEKGGFKTPEEANEQVIKMRKEYYKFSEE